MRISLCSKILEGENLVDLVADGWIILKLILKKILYEDLDCIHTSYDQVDWQISVDTGMSFSAKWKLGTSWLSEKILASKRDRAQRSQDVSLSCEIALAC
jgi:hypothetical protein